MVSRNTNYFGDKSKRGRKAGVCRKHRTNYKCGRGCDNCSHFISSLDGLGAGLPKGNSSCATDCTRDELTILTVSCRVNATSYYDWLEDDDEDDDARRRLEEDDAENATALADDGDDGDGDDVADDGDYSPPWWSYPGADCADQTDFVAFGPGFANTTCDGIVPAFGCDVVGDYCPMACYGCDEALAPGFVPFVVTERQSVWLALVTRFRPAPFQLPSMPSMPGGSAEGAPSMPSMPKLPDGLPKLPDGLPKLPDGLPKLPDGLPSLPKFKNPFN